MPQVTPTETGFVGLSFDCNGQPGTDTSGTPVAPGTGLLYTHSTVSGSVVGTGTVSAVPNYNDSHNEWFESERLAGIKLKWIPNANLTWQGNSGFGPFGYVNGYYGFDLDGFKLNATSTTGISQYSQLQLNDELSFVKQFAYNRPWKRFIKFPKRSLVSKTYMPSGSITPPNVLGPNQNVAGFWKKAGSSAFSYGGGNNKTDAQHFTHILWGFFINNPHSTVSLSNNGLGRLEVTTYWVYKDRV